METSADREFRDEVLKLLKEIRDAKPASYPVYYPIYQPYYPNTWPANPFPYRQYGYPPYVYMGGMQQAVVTNVPASQATSGGIPFTQTNHAKFYGMEESTAGPNNQSNGL